MTMPSNNESLWSSSSSARPKTNRYIDEIAAFNEEGFEKSIIDGYAKHILQDPELRLTRRFSKEVTSFFRNEPISPLKPVLGAVVERVDAGDSDKGSLYRPGEDSANEDAASEDMCVDKPESAVEAGRIKNSLESSSRVQNISLLKPTLKTSAKGKIVAPTSAAAQWDKWHERKGKYSTDKIEQLLALPGYGAVNSIGIRSTLPKQAAFVPLQKCPAEYNWRMESGIHVFKPTYNAFKDFTTFLSWVEMIAGREVGVAKVVMPKGALKCLDQCREESDGVLLKSQKLQVSRLEPTLHDVAFYEVAMEEMGCSHVDLEAFKQHRNTITNTGMCNRAEAHNSMTGDFDHNGPREENGAGEHCSKNGDGWAILEEKMLHGNADENRASLNIRERVTSTLRRQLQLGDPDLSGLAGNRLRKYSRPLNGNDHSHIHICHTSGVPVAMHVKHAAAYSISYLHKGAPKYWTVLKPGQHQKLEKITHLLLAQKVVLSERGLRREHPPQCDQFLGHRSLYLPTATLKLLEMEHERVVQQQNETIITFPFAYIQAISTGPNITEEILYASKWWERFPKKNLIQACRPTDSRGCVAFDLGSLQMAYRQAAAYKSIQHTSPKTSGWKVSHFSTSQTTKVCLETSKVSNKRVLDGYVEGTCREELEVGCYEGLFFKHRRRSSLAKADQTVQRWRAVGNGPNKLGERLRKGKALKRSKEKTRWPRQETSRRGNAEESKVLENVDAIFAASKN